MRYGKLEKGLYFEWEIEVNAPLSEVWDFASNTDRLNAAIGSGTNEYTEIPNPKGGSFLYGKTVNGGIVSEFREFPYEWLENKYVGVYREYSRGPVKKMLFDNIFTETENGFKIKFIMQFETSSFIFNPIIKFEVYKNSIPNFRETFKHLEKFAKRIESKPLPVFGFVPSSGDNQRRSELINKFNIIKTEDSIREKIAIYILDTPDNDLLKIKPYAVAHQICENKRRVLEFFLRATKEGFFDLNWDILCPSCRGPKSSSRHLNELEDSVHCPTCNIDYSGEFDKSVELTFVPTEKLRKVEGGIYCFGGPGRTPHIRVQWRVKGKGNEKVKYFVQKGTYRIFSLQKKEIINIECDPNFPEVKEINYPNTEDLIRCATGEIEFNFENSDEEECLIRIERTTWMDDIVTAYEVTAMQEFRDLFSSEV
ncbi:MAG: hypothetical protein KDK36_00295, partial [Leptospiraceae bacterium]|nr:hypothetical protein [Leptospiraceae bacterium]